MTEHDPVQSDYAEKNLAKNDLAQNSTAWHRCSPISAVYFLIAQVRSAFNLLPVFLGLIINESTRSWLADYGIFVIGIWLVAQAILSFWFFRYRYHSDELEVKSGFFQKNHLQIKFDRIQEIQLNQPIYFRAFRLWRVDIETAGSSQTELSIPGIPQLEAKNLRAAVKNITDGLAGLDESDKNEKANTDFHIHLKPADLVRYGLMYNQTLFFLLFSYIFISQSDILLNMAGNWIERSWIYDYLDTSSQTMGKGVFVLLLVATAFAGICLSYTISICIALLFYWRYEFVIKADKYQCHASGINKFRRGFEAYKLQNIRIDQSFFAKLLGRYRVEMRKANEPNSHQGPSSKRFHIPVMDRTQLNELKAHLNIAPATWHRYLLTPKLIKGSIYGTLLAGIVLPFSVFMTWLPIYSSPLILLLALGIATLSWFKSGYAIDDNWLAVKKGILSTKTTFVPISKCQKCSMNQGPLAKLLDSVSLTLWDGSSINYLTHLKADIAKDLYSNLIAGAGSSKIRWM